MGEEQTAVPQDQVRILKIAEGGSANSVPCGPWRYGRDRLAVLQIAEAGADRASQIVLLSSAEQPRGCLSRFRCSYRPCGPGDGIVVELD